MDRLPIVTAQERYALRWLAQYGPGKYWEFTKLGVLVSDFDDLVYFVDNHTVDLTHKGRAVVEAMERRSQ